MEARLASVEAAVESIQDRVGVIETDLRMMLKAGMGAFILTWAGMIALGGGLASMIARGFGWI